MFQEAKTETAATYRGI